MSRDKKEWIKLIIDGAKEFLKEYQPPKRLDVNILGMAPEWIDFIQKAAADCALAQVRVLPYKLRGQCAFAYIMYGGDIDGFCRRTGISRIREFISRQDYDEINALFMSEGIVIYNR